MSTYRLYNRLLMKAFSFFILLAVSVSSFAQGTITGNIVYANDVLSPIHDSTMVRLYQGNTLVREIPLSSDGSFTFDTVASGTYYVRAVVSKTAGGWNAMDSYRVQRNFVGILPPLSGIYLMAADVNFSGGTPGAVDELAICRRFTYNIPHFTPEWVSQSLWATVTSNTTLALTIKVLCTGDVDGSYIPY